MPRERQLIVDVLNFEQTPTRWLNWFLARYEDNGLDLEMLKQIRDELREQLFQHGLGSLVIAAQKYPIKIIPVLRERSRTFKGAGGIESWRPDPTDPREHLYHTLIAAIEDGSFKFLQQTCNNCGKFYWHRGDYCDLKCGREFNRKGSAERMRRLRRKRKKEGKRGN